MTLVPERYPNLGGEPLAYCRFDLDGRWYDFQGELSGYATVLVGGLHWYSDGGLEVVTKNPYGNPITFVTAQKLIEVWDDCMKEKALGEWDRAIIAFIRELPGDHRIFLWFH